MDFLGGQWLRLCLPMQGTRVRSLVQEDSTHCRATKPVGHNYWADAPWSLCSTTGEATARALEPVLHGRRGHCMRPGACAPWQERRLQWEAHVLQWESSPVRWNERKPTHSTEDPAQPKINKKVRYVLKNRLEISGLSLGSLGISKSWIQLLGL